MIIAYKAEKQYVYFNKNNTLEEYKEEIKYMSIIDDMKRRTDFTEREKNILDYLLKHPEKIEGMSAKELGYATFSSAAAVTRFCQKIGCKGYPDFKFEFVTSLRINGIMENKPHEKIEEKDNIVSMLHKVEKMRNKAMEEAKRDISLEQMIRVCKLFVNADYIDFYCYDCNVYLAQYASNLLYHCGKVAITHIATNEQELMAMNSNERHIAVIISHTGENMRLIEIAKALRKTKTKIIVIGAAKNTTLPKYADEFLKAATAKQFDEFWTSIFFMSATFLFDIIFGMVFSSTYHNSINLNKCYEEVGESRWWRTIE